MILPSRATISSILALVSASPSRSYEQTNSISALQGAIKLNNAVAYSVCDIVFQSFTAVIAIKRNSTSNYILTSACQALGYPLSASSTTSTISTSSSWSMNTVPLASSTTPSPSSSNTASRSSSYPSISTSTISSSPIIVKGTYYGYNGGGNNQNLPICQGGYIRDPAGGGGCVECPEYTC